MVEKYGKKPYLFAAIAILGWSTSATFGGLLSNAANPIVVVTLIQIVALFALVFYRHFFAREAGRLRRIVRLARKDRYFAMMMILFSALLTGYQLLFYFAVMGPARIQANLANYLWPILLYLLLHSPMFRRNEPMRLLDLALLVLAFLGALSLAFEVNVFTKGVDIDALLGLAAGGAAACFAAAYMTISSHLINEAERANDTIKSSDIYTAALILSIPLLGMVVWGLGLDATQAIVAGSDALCIVWLGVVTVALAQTFWTKAINMGHASKIPVLAYLVPVLSTALQVFVFKDAITPNLLLGLVFIVTASVFTARVFGQILAETMALVVFMYVGFAAFMEPQFFAQIGAGNTDTIGVQLFALLTAFSLSRQAQLIQSDRDRLFLWKSKVGSILRHFDSSRPENANVDPSNDDVRLVLDRARTLVTAMVHIDQSSTISRRAANYSEYQSSESRLFDAVQRAKNAPAKAGQIFDELQEVAAEIRSSGTERLGRGEVVSITVLGVIASVLFLANSHANTPRQIISMFICATVAFLVFRVIHQNAKPALSDINDLASFQDISGLKDAPLYVGDFSKLNIRSDVRKLERKIALFEQGKGHAVYHSADPENPIFQLSKSRINGFAFLTFGAMLVLGILIGF